MFDRFGIELHQPYSHQAGLSCRAQAFLQKSLSLCTQVGDRWGMGTAYRNLGLTALAHGDADKAQALLRKSLDIFGNYIVGWDIARSLTYLGDAASMVDELAEAHISYVNALHLAIGAKSIPVALDVVMGLARLQLRSGKTGRAFEPADFVSNHPAGTQATRTDASQLALEAGRK
jgi:hypothetical protein